MARSLPAPCTSIGGSLDFGSSRPSARSSLILSSSNSAFLPRGWFPKHASGPEGRRVGGRVEVLRTHVSTVSMRCPTSAWSSSASLALGATNHTGCWGPSRRASFQRPTVPLLGVRRTGSTLSASRGSAGHLSTSEASTKAVGSHGRAGTTATPSAPPLSLSANSVPGGHASPAKTASELQRREESDAVLSRWLAEFDLPDGCEKERGRDGPKAKHEGDACVSANVSSEEDGNGGARDASKDPRAEAVPWEEGRDSDGDSNRVIRTWILKEAPAPVPQGSTDRCSGKVMSPGGQVAVTPGGGAIEKGGNTSTEGGDAQRNESSVLPRPSPGSLQNDLDLRIQKLPHASRLYLPPSSDWRGIATAAAVLGSWVATWTVAMFVVKVPRVFPEIPARLLGGPMISAALSSVFGWPPHSASVSLSSVPFTLAVFCVLEFLYTGLFITAHDAIHGTVAYRCRPLNDFVGRTALAMYAWFDFDNLKAAHWEHHRLTGQSFGDPDFHRGDARLLPWFAAFMRHYLTVSQFTRIISWAMLLTWLGAPLENQAIFNAGAGLVSAFRLFYVGTFLPHRPDAGQVVDGETRASPDLDLNGVEMPWHVSKSSNLPMPLSFFACYHFGYHWEHHRWPYAPWWQLPACRRIACRERDLLRAAAGQSGAGGATA